MNWIKNHMTISCDIAFLIAIAITMTVAVLYRFL